MDIIKLRNLSRFFSDTIDTLALNWKKVLPVSACVFLPVAVLYAFSFKLLFACLPELAGLKDLPPGEAGHALTLLTGLILPFILLFLAMILFRLATGFMTMFAAKSLFEGTRTVPELLKETAGLLPAYIGQWVVTGSIMSVVVLAYYAIAVFAGVSMGMSRVAHGSAIAGILAIIAATIAYLAFTLWFQVKTCFAPIALSFEKGFGAFDSLGKSFRLVRGQFWRVLGLTLLATIALSFSLTIMTGPVVFTLMIPGYVGMIKSMIADQNNWEGMLRLFSGSFVWGMAASLFLNAVGSALLYPAYLSLLYADLKIRKSELTESVTPVQGTV